MPRIELGASRTRNERSTDDLHPVRDVQIANNFTSQQRLNLRFITLRPRQESNLHHRFRKPVLYPLRYGDKR